MIFFKNVQAAMHEIAAEANGRLAVIVEHTSLNLILVDALCQQQPDDSVKLRTRRIIGKSARVGHHAAINGRGGSLGKRFKTAQLMDDTKDDFAGAAQFGEGDELRRLDVGI